MQLEAEEGRSLGAYSGGAHWRAAVRCLPHTMPTPRLLQLIGGRLYAACLTPCPRPPFSSSLEGGCTLPHTYTTPMRPPSPYSCLIVR